MPGNIQSAQVIFTTDRLRRLHTQKNLILWVLWVNSMPKGLPKTKSPDEEAGLPTVMAAMQSSGVSSVAHAKAPPLTALHWSHLARS